MNTPNKIIVHHTAVSRATQPRQFFVVNRYHQTATDEAGNYLYHYGAPSSMGYYGGYHIFIEPDGSEWRYREDYEDGAHTKGQNTSSLAVALAGNFDSEMPTPEQVVTLRARLQKWQARYSIADIDLFPHRKYSTKTCYGRLLADEWARTLVKPVELDAKKELEIAELKSQIDSLRAIILRLQIIIRQLYGQR